MDIRTILVTTLLSLLQTPFLGAQSPDFSSDFATLLRTPPASGAEFLLDATLESYKILDSDPKNYTVELSLLQGEWNDVTSITLYRAKAWLQGEEYSLLFPERRPRTPDGVSIPLNSKILARLVYVRTEKQSEGSPILSFRGLGIRLLK